MVARGKWELSGVIEGRKKRRKKREKKKWRARKEESY